MSAQVNKNWSTDQSCVIGDDGDGTEMMLLCCCCHYRYSSLMDCIDPGMNGN